MAQEFQFPIGAQQILTPDVGDEPLTYEEQQEAWILRDRAVEDFLKDVAQTGDVVILGTDGLVPADNLGAGATGTSVFLRGDRQWAVVPGAVAGTHSVGISNVGNTGGSTGLATGTAVRLMLVGSNNITLSQSSNGGSATVAIFGGGGGAGGTQTIGVSNLGNTSGTSGAATGSAVAFYIAGGNNITASQSLNGASATVTLSAANQSNQSLGLYGSSQTTGAASSTTVDARSVTLVGQGAVSVGASGGSFLISAPNTVAQSAESQTHGISNLGNTSGTSGVASGAQVRMLLAGGNNVTLSQSLNGASGTVTISAAAQTNQTVGLYASSNTVLTSSGTADARSLSVRGVGAASVGVSGNELVLSVPAQTVQSLGIYASSQTTGASSSTTVDARSLTLVGQGGVSVGASAGSILISGATGGAGGSFSAGVSNLGNTAGSTGATGTRLVFAGVSGMTLSQSTDANGATVSIVPNVASSSLVNQHHLYSFAAGSNANTTGTINLFQLANAVSFSRVDVLMTVSAATSAATNTAANAQSWVWGLYTRSGSTLSPLTVGSSSTTWSWASNSGRYSSLTGQRMVSFALATALTPGNYHFLVQASTATSSVGANTTSLAMTMAPIAGFLPANMSIADMDALTNNTVNAMQPIHGLKSANGITATSQTIQASEVGMTGANQQRANMIFVLRNV